MGTNIQLMMNGTAIEMDRTSVFSISLDNLLPVANKKSISSLSVRLTNRFIDVYRVHRREILE